MVTTKWLRTNKRSLGKPGFHCIAKSNLPEFYLLWQQSKKFLHQLLSTLEEKVFPNKEAFIFSLAFMKLISIFLASFLPHEYDAFCEKCCLIFFGRE